MKLALGFLILGVIVLLAVLLYFYNQKQWRIRFRKAEKGVQVFWDKMKDSGEYIVRYGNKSGNLDKTIKTRDTTIEINDLNACGQYYLKVDDSPETFYQFNDLNAPLNLRVEF
jgi:hypothetical protein